VLINYIKNIITHAIVMCITTFKNNIINWINCLFNKSVERGGAKAAAMNNNLNKFVNQM
tara:strand:+ start:2756 stop:2932 length:177 start_codon:yes stop_codon:yes gene_type:complete